MARNRQEQRSSGEYGGFVPVVFARSIERSEHYQQLLIDHDIPAIIGSDGDLADEQACGLYRRGGMTQGVPVLVPEVLLDEASEIIADRENLNEFEGPEDKSDEEDENFGLHEELETEIEQFDEDELFQEGPDEVE